MTFGHPWVTMVGIYALLSGTAKLAELQWQRNKHTCIFSLYIEKNPLAVTEYSWQAALSQPIMGFSAKVWARYSGTPCSTSGTFFTSSFSHFVRETRVLRVVSQHNQYNQRLTGSPGQPPSCPWASSWPGSHSLSPDRPHMLLRTSWCVSWLSLNYVSPTAVCTCD